MIQPMGPKDKPLDAEIVASQQDPVMQGGYFSKCW
jgi:hypothetical protein